MGFLHRKIGRGPQGAYGQGLATQLSLELEAAIVPQNYPDPNEYLADQSLQEPCSLNGSCTDCQTGCCNECWFAHYQWLGEELPDIGLTQVEEVTGILAWLSAVWEKNNRPPIQWIVSEGGQVSGLFLRLQSIPRLSSGMRESAA